MNVGILCGAPPNINDAVGDFSWLLAQELSSKHNVSLIVSGVDDTVSPVNTSPVSIYPVSNGWGIQTVKDVLHLVQRLKPQIILVHFVPQLYGWYGSKPFFVLLLMILRIKGSRIITVAHEFSVPFGPSLKLMLLASIHQLFLRVILKASRRIVLTTQDRFDLFKQRFPRRKADFHKIPIGCTIPVTPIDDAKKQHMRRRLGIRAEELVVSTFSSVVGLDRKLLAKLFNWFICEGWPIRILLIGKGGEALQRKLAHDPAILERIVVTGPVSSEAVSEYLSLSDLYVVFYNGGASTRRTSLMAPLAHGTPSISNRGALTDPSFASSGALQLMNGVMEEADIRLLRQLCKDTEMRRRLGKHGQAFFEEHFSWAKIGQQYLHVLQDALAK